MTELPKKIQKRIVEQRDEWLVEEQWINASIFVSLTSMIAKELYQDLAMAMEALEFYATPWGIHHGSPIRAVNKFTQKRLNEVGATAQATLSTLRSKYNDQETERGD